MTTVHSMALEKCIRGRPESRTDPDKANAKNTKEMCKKRHAQAERVRRRHHKSFIVDIYHGVLDSALKKACSDSSDLKAPTKEKILEAEIIGRHMDRRLIKLTERALALEKQSNLEKDKIIDQKDQALHRKDLIIDQKSRIIHENDQALRQKHLVIEDMEWTDPRFRGKHDHHCRSFTHLPIRATEQGQCQKSLAHYLSSSDSSSAGSFFAPPSPASSPPPPCGGIQSISFEKCKESAKKMER